MAPCPWQGGVAGFRWNECLQTAMRSASAIGPAPAPALLLLKATIRVATVNRLIASGLQNRPFCIAISAVLQVEKGRIAMPNGPFQVRHAMLLPWRPAQAPYTLYIYMHGPSGGLWHRELCLRANGACRLLSHLAKCSGVVTAVGRIVHFFVGLRVLCP